MEKKKLEHIVTIYIKKTFGCSLHEASDITEKYHDLDSCIEEAIRRFGRPKRRNPDELPVYCL